MVPKPVAYRLLEPALNLPQTLRINCREGKVESLLADLAMHKLDIVLTDSPMPRTVNVRRFNHLLGECGVSFFATTALREQYAAPFPECLNGAPILLSGEDSGLPHQLTQWMNEHNIVLRIAGEFDDSALMSAFGQAGAGFFAAPITISDMLKRQFDVDNIGSTDEIRHQFYAITVQRKLTHPSVLAISQGAAQDSFLIR